MILSICTGTYNRLPHLRKMIMTARRSIGVGIPYEFVIADGGSRDGTIQWCKEQLDIRLIEQGKLLGCVAAFNAASYKASGDYVILANDDIEFIDESIQAAISFMQDNPTVGVGCFYQDRNGKTWHVEYMQAMYNGNPVPTPYGQVCIVPRWLGDKLGWWGNYLRCYGGDNELSCKVLEYGYKVQPIPCTKIHDSVVEDSLRDHNAEALKSNPDSQLWINRWTRDGGFGANIQDVPLEPNPIQRKYRILYAPIYERGHTIQRIQRTGLRRSLANYGMVTEVDYLSESFGKVWDVACNFQPDMFITQIQDGKNVSESQIVELRHEYPKALFVNWNGDYHPENLTDPKYVDILKHYHHAGFVTTQFIPMWESKGVNAFYWQIGYEYANDNLKVTSHDVLFLGNCYSKERYKLGWLLRRLNHYNVGIYGDWKNDVKADGKNLYNFDEGASLYKRCKVAIGDSQWPHATGFVSNRLFQAMSAGALLLQQNFDGLESLLGLKDEVHLVVWEDLSDLTEKISYYISNESDRKRIAKTGQQYILDHHSFDARVTELFMRVNL